MSHHGYIPVAQQFLSRVSRPNILEIGVDRGQTLVPMLFWLSRAKNDFKVTSVDIRFDASLEVILKYTGFLDSDKFKFVVDNSLNYLPTLGQNTEKFDLIFLDGDHNYYTVSRELDLLKDLLSPSGLLIVDDYFGKWSERDLFYSERDTHSQIESATPAVKTDKVGVKAAVDEFLGNNLSWTASAPIGGEPVVLFRKPTQ